MDSDMPWPRLGDVLFGSGPDWRMNATFCLAGRASALAEGYRRGGDQLVDHVGRTYADQDFLVYPIVFSYRQSLELQLKDLIAHGNDLFGIDASPMHTHELVRLWAAARPLLNRRWPTPAPEAANDLDAVEQVLRQFDEVDRRSDAFRYPRNRAGELSIPVDMPAVNLANLRDVVGRISSFFSGCLDALDADISARDDGY